MENLVTQVQSLFEQDSIWLWPAMAGIAAFAAVLIKLVSKGLAIYLRKFAKRTSSTWDDLGVDLLESFKGLVIFTILFFLLTRALKQSPAAHKVLLIWTVSAVVFQLGFWGLHVIRTWKEIVIQTKTEKDPSASAALGLLFTAVQGVFLIILVMIGLSNLGVDVTALIGGLGIGGIAVALAAQNVLGDLLASLSIVLDKPFVIGDFIVAGEQVGTVEDIGIKTTRLRSLSGEQLILSNKDLLESRLQNFKRMWVRRVVQKFGVVYSTPAEVLEKIPVWVREVIEAQAQLKFDRCHFASYGDSSLDFEFVFFVEDPTYNVFMDLQQTVLLGIFKKFAAENVDFAFPTRTLYLEKGAEA